MHNSTRWTALNVTSVLLILRAYIGSATQLFTIPDYIDYFIILLCIILCFMQVLVRRYPIGELVPLFVTSLIVLISALLSREYTVFYSLMMILLIGRTDVKEYLRKYQKTRVILFSLIVLLYTLELMTGVIEISFKRNRATFTGGFATGNAFAFLCFWLISSEIYINFEKKSNWNLIVLCIFQFLFSYIAACKTAMLLAILNCFFLLILKNYRVPERIITIACRWMFPVLGILYLAATIIFARGSGKLYTLVYMIDYALTGRIRNTAYLYEKYGFTVLGQQIEKGAIEYNDYYRLTRATVDGVYPLLFLQIGLIVFVLISVAFVLVNKRYYISKLDCYFLILLVLSGLSEMFVANSIICFPFLLLGGAIFRKQKKPQLGRDI